MEKIPDLPFTDSSIMPFGKYKGRTLANVPAYYLLWLNNKGCDHPGVNRYIQENLELLNKEVSKIKR
ncbi:MAG TPA: DUF3820 family protein [Chitinophagaceae bacterium]|nr:DUF3820 family protein [Chitinophagaceae bacterium]